MPRYRNSEWNLPDKLENWTQVNTALLMDIRDELKAVNEKLSVLQCPNFVGIPKKLERIARNTVKPKRKAK